uniref:GRIP domain-containing protein n=3 Tax=Parascaris univalens TaxID=6257 RepID=A0A915C0P5_PARUN
VAFFGDTTSDENTTENDDASVPTLLPFPRRSPPADSHTGAVRQTAILDDEESEETELHDELMMGDDEEDNPSETDDDRSVNGNGASHIAGKWWFGKSTKFIPHCAKRGCTHVHSSECVGGEYLTPTQRRTKEIHLLRKQLKLALSQIEDKDAHLAQLRDRLNELETVIESSHSLGDTHRLMSRHNEIIEQHAREKEALIEKHEIRVRQLIQEAVDARAEAVKLKMTLKDLKNKKEKRSLSDKSTMTEVIEMTPDVPTPRIHPDPPVMSASFPPSPQAEKAVQPTITIPQEVLLQLQAYQNEAIVWRTKAAQLEIVVKEQLVKTQQASELERYRSENERLRLIVQKHVDMASPQMVDSGIETTLSFLSPERRSSIASECFVPQCIDRKAQLVNENTQLNEKVDEQMLRINELESDVSLLRNTIDSLEEESKKSFTTMEQLSKEIEEKTAEVQAANMAIVRLQGEVATKTKAICYLEERHQVYRNTILDNHLVVKDESTEDWRRGFSDPRYVVNLSKTVQTVLTSEALSHNEKQFHSLHDKLKELEQEFSSKKSNMHERFREIEQNLIMKTSLVESLSNQLEQADKEAISESARHQKEREAFQSRLLELGRIAERVPVLEFEVERLQQERSMLELKLRSAREEFDTGLEMALAKSLKKYQQQAAYWNEKMATAAAQQDALKNQIAAMEKEMDEIRLRSDVEKADMARRLTSSIDHVTQLNKLMNRTMRDAQVDAHPHVVSKYVACRPNARNKMTDIGKGDLFDEVEERLKLCQGELNTTRRQVEVLQQKLIDTAQVQTGGHSKMPTFSPVLLRTSREIQVTDAEEFPSRSNETAEKLYEKIDELEKRNVDLAARMRECQEEKQNMIKMQRQQVAQLVAEFDIVRKELDQEMNRYEDERRKLKNRVEVLEKVKADRDRLIEHLRRIETANGEVSPQLLMPKASINGASVERPIKDKIDSESSYEKENVLSIKRCISVPHMYSKMASACDEMCALRERNSVLARVNAHLTRELMSLRRSVQSSIQHTVSRVSDVNSHNGKSPSMRSELSPSLGDLAADLNQVRTDLQNILIQIDNAADGAQRESTHSSDEADVASSKAESVRSPEPHETEPLRRALKRSRAEREALKEQLDRVTLQLQDACRELDLYKREPRDDVIKQSHNPHLPRSRSFVEIGRATVDLDEYLRWKEKAGTMFRELNRIRKQHCLCDAERRELRLQLVMMRGELGLAQCQLVELSTRPRHEGARNTMSQSVAVTSPSDRKARRGVGEKVRSSARSDGTHEQGDSSGTYVTARASFSSLNDVTSLSEPDLSSRSQSRHEDFINLKFRASKKLFSKEEERRRNAEEHDEIIKEAAKAQLVALKQQNDRLREELTLPQRCPADERELEMKQLAMMNDSLRDEIHTIRSELECLRTAADARLSLYEQREAERKVEFSHLLMQIDEFNVEKEKRSKEEAVRRAAYEARISMINRENELLLKKMDEVEKERQEMYLVMFKKGQQAAEHDIQEVKAVDEMTEDRIVLRFLHDAFYYFMLNKGDSREHLQAIMTMLNFTTQQKEDVYRRRGASH